MFILQQHVTYQLFRIAWGFECGSAGSLEQRALELVNYILCLKKMRAIKYVYIYIQFVYRGGGGSFSRF